MNKGGGDGRGGGGKSSGAGKGSNPSDGKSEKKKKWYNSNPENLTTKEHNDKTYYWCMNSNFGHGKWVTHTEEACPHWRKQSSQDSKPNDLDNSGLMVMNLAECGFLSMNIL